MVVLVELEAWQVTESSVSTKHVPLNSRRCSNIWGLGNCELLYHLRHLYRLELQRGQWVIPITMIDWEMLRTVLFSIGSYPILIIILIIMVILLTLPLRLCRPLLLLLLRSRVQHQRDEGGC